MESDTNVLDNSVTSLSYSTVSNLSACLSLEQDVSRRDWTGVAGVLGFDARQIRLMQQHRDSSKGWLLLTTWEDMPVRSSLRLFIFALLEKKMGECLDLIKDDEAVSDADYERVLAEYERLKKEGKIKSMFQRFKLEDVYHVLNPQVVHRPTPGVESPVSEQEQSSRVTEALQRLAVVDDKPSREKNSVFISYCPESNRKFNSQLSKFANVLRNQGYTVYYEPFCDREVRRYGGLNCWKEACINKSEDIIVICTPEYCREDRKKIDGGTSKIEVDSRLLRDLAYSCEDHRLIPVVLDNFKINKRNMPTWLQALRAFKWPSNEQDFLLCLAKQSKYVLKPPSRDQMRILKPIVIDFAGARKHNPYK